MDGVAILIALGQKLPAPLPIGLICILAVDRMGMCIVYGGMSAWNMFCLQLTWANGGSGNSGQLTSFRKVQGKYRAVVQ